MTDLEIEKEEKLVDVRIFRIPIADFDYWMQIVRSYGSNRQVAFRMLLDGYAFMGIAGKLLSHLESLEERVQTLEQHWRKEGGNLPEIKEEKPNVFGGARI